jgi:P-type Ca2+ transporter type 2C
VLAVAGGPVESATQAGLRGLTLLGFVGLIDPVRPEVPAAIARCRRAGVAVVMVTGDHPDTALAIGRELGLARDRAEVVTGADLAAIAQDRARFDAKVAEAHIFARVEPTQKLDIVESMRRAGHFVAVTGDGVNDAPALKAAHIGAAMGRGGTDVARAAGDLILTDDNFASIVSGIAQGRAAYDNVRKVTLMLVSTGAAEIVLFFLAQFSGLPLPLTAVQLLWLNLVTNGIQDVALAFEKGEPKALERPPRPPNQPLFDRPMVEATLLSGAVMGGLAFGCFAWMIFAGWSVESARNILLLLMVTLENAQVLNCRSETRSVFAVPLRDNPFVVLAVLAAQAVHIAAMNLPGLRDVLGVAPLPAETWLVVAAIASILVAAFEGYKFLRRRQAEFAYTPGS